MPGSRRRYGLPGSMARTAFFDRANRYGQVLASGLSIEDVEAWPDVLQAVSGEDIVAVAREVLEVESSVTGWLTGEEG